MNTVISIILWIAYVVALYFSVFLVLVYLDKKRLFSIEESADKISKFPLVSVLIPAYNEEKTILRTLESVHALDYPKDKLEVIVINDGSKDNTEKVIRTYIKNKPHFQLLSHPNRGKAASLNRALNLATGEFFACLDADSFVESSTLKKMLQIYEKENNPNLAIVTPAMKVYQPQNMLQKVQWLEYLVIILISRLSSHLDSLYVAPGPFSLYRTAIIRKIGGFDEKNITEDQEIAYRLQQHQYLIKQCTNGYVYTTAPPELKPFYHQRRRWYLGGIACLHQYRKLVANKKYGDFGLMQMVKNVVGFILAVTGIIIAGYFFVLPLFQTLKEMIMVNFNFMPYLQTLKIKITFLNFLLADFRKGLIILFLFIIGGFFFYQAHRNAKEKILGFGWVPLIPYFAFYYTLKGIILILCMVEFVRGKKVKW
ncbi:glycosyltransferase [Candidatus Woesearchaeota archaeon]|nr:glycosyltransferase [Candidatus Woesearchaeota archaeon]